MKKGARNERYPTCYVLEAETYVWTKGSQHMLVEIVSMPMSEASVQIDTPLE